MSKSSSLRRKIAKKKAAAAAINYDNAKPHQVAALEAERDKLIANAMRRLSASKRALMHKGKGGPDRA